MISKPTGLFFTRLSRCTPVVAWCDVVTSLSFPSFAIYWMNFIVPSFVFVLSSCLLCGTAAMTCTARTQTAHRKWIIRSISHTVLAMCQFSVSPTPFPSFLMTPTVTWSGEGVPPKSFGGENGSLKWVKSNHRLEWQSSTYKFKPMSISMYCFQQCRCVSLLLWLT